MIDLDNLPRLPILLTKAEALDYAAKGLEESAAHVSLVSTIVDALKGEPDAANSKVLKHIQAHLPDAAIQVAAAKDAAAAIRSLALEERVVAARMARERKAAL